MKRDTGLAAATALAALLAIASAPWALSLPWLNFVFKPLATLGVIAYAWPRGAHTPVLRRWLLAPVSTPPGSASAKTASKTLCNCLNVSEASVCAGIARGLDLNGLKQELKCGTSCGSCIPEIKRLLAQQPMATHA